MLAQVDAADGSAHSYADRAADGASVAREYRVGELPRGRDHSTHLALLPSASCSHHRGVWAESAGTQGHLTRLRVIGQLLDRGHTLGGIGELLSAWEQAMTSRAARLRAGDDRRGRTSYRCL
jgi:hypothetical protein